MTTNNDYTYSNFDNLDAFKAALPKVADELLDHYDEDNFIGAVYYYPTVAEFAKYEMVDGWYQAHDWDNQDYNGAPNPMDYIDFDQLGRALVNTWDETNHYEAKNGAVVEFEA